MSTRNDFAIQLKNAVNAIIEAKPGDILQRLAEMQHVVDTHFPEPALDEPAGVGDLRGFLESAQIFMNTFAKKAQELRKQGLSDEAQVMERFIARYTKMDTDGELFMWTDRISYSNCS